MVETLGTGQTIEMADTIHFRRQHACDRIRRHIGERRILDHGGAVEDAAQAMTRVPDPLQQTRDRVDIRDIACLQQDLDTLRAEIGDRCSGVCIGMCTARGEDERARAPLGQPYGCRHAEAAKSPDHKMRAIRPDRKRTG